MAAINIVQILGRLGKDPQVVYTMEDSGLQVVAFPVVTLSSMKPRNGQYLVGMQA